MEDLSTLKTSDEYRLIEIYCQKKRKPSAKPRKAACMCSLDSQRGYDQFDNVAEKLAEIADNGLLDEEGLEPDSPVEKDANSEVILRLVDLLKKSGDELNKTICSNQDLLRQLQKTFSYDLFTKVTQAFIKSSVPEYYKKREQIALTLEVTSRLKALDLQPMNRVMGYGAQYLQENFTPWVKQHGGWEKAIDDDGDEEVH